MTRPYSMDLRERVVSAVEEDGQSRRQAAFRFGVGVSTVVKWLRRYRDTGSVAPDRIGGHKPSKIVGAHRDWLIARCHTDDFTLRGLVDELAERGLDVDYRSVWAFVHAQELTHKKRRWSPASVTARTSPATGRDG
jgi:putative transposase